MYYECRQCNRRFEELKALGKLRFCGDFWQCTDCNHDITKDLDTWYKEVTEMGKFMAAASLGDPENDNELNVYVETDLPTNSPSVVLNFNPANQRKP